MVAVPAATPVTTPDELTDATAAFELVQVPPPVASVSDVVDDWHTVLLPLMAAGGAVMVTAFVAADPQPLLYVMVADPPEIPVTTPPASTVAMPVLLLVQVPPRLVFARVVVLATQMLIALPGVMAAAAAMMVTVVVAGVPQPLV
jgi:hypothetical protein